jgi:uncharacterized membrane protein YccC
MTAASPTISTPRHAPFTEWLRVATPALLFGLRLWASVCVAFYVAFALELSEPSWAATTAALVCQPVLGASLRKSMFRMIGTVIGAIAIVVLAAFFRQDPVSFLVGLALWCAASGFVATLLTNFAAYAAALAGYTAAIIAIDVLGPVGSTNGIVFLFAIDRALEICIGIVSAGVVLALTDLGHSRRKLATEFAALSSAIMDGFTNCFVTASGNLDQFQASRRELLRRVIALYPMIDAAIGEASDLRYRSAVLQRGVAGLMETISAWRKIAIAIEFHGDATTRQEANAVHDQLPRARLSPDATGSTEEPAALRDACCSSVRSLTRFDAQTPMQRLLADNAAAGMLGMARALNGLTGVIDPRDVVGVRGSARLRVADWMPAFVNSARVLFAVGTISLFWVVSAWPNGVAAITFCAVIVILLPPSGDAAYSASLLFFLGSALSAVLAAIVVFGLLPQVVTFPTLCLILGLVLVPLGFLNARGWKPMFTFAAAVNFLPLLNITNGMTYDASSFWNGAIAIVAGIGFGVIAMLVIPPLAPATRTQRLLSLTLADLRRLAKRASPGRATEWEGRGVARLLAMPDKAEPVERSELAAAVAVGKEIVRFRHIAPRFVPSAMVDAALAALAEGRSAEAVERLDDIDRQVAALPRARSRIPLSLRASILVISGQLSQFASYFDRQLQ